MSIDLDKQTALKTLRTRLLSAWVKITHTHTTIDCIWTMEKMSNSVCYFSPLFPNCFFHSKWSKNVDDRQHHLPCHCWGLRDLFRCIYTTAEAPKIASSCLVILTNTWFLWCTRASQMASWSVQPFLQGSWTWLTDRQISCSICSSRPHPAVFLQYGLMIKSDQSNLSTGRFAPPAQIFNHLKPVYKRFI